ncbi:pyridoxal-dependent decarboxylase [Algoriella sp.]|uniref:pyridoxal phosphate-dependent decarboxylase family protein n=1 Tax=Algoriella sp. TaxID=1872434 RepID=UPI001AFFCEC4|nr:pyridoxal-dependent decarboxylase [Algoriella sp.]MBO6213819.1 aspartate aminotransferase family protein [Algoriella sp.]
MNSTLQHDLIQIEELLNLTQQEALAFLAKINEIPTTPVFENCEKAKLNTEGISGKEALNLFKERFGNMINSSTGPRYLGYVTGGATPASIMGDWLATVYDQNTQAVKGQGDLSANIELETIQLLLDLFNLPSNFLGGFVTGATMSNFTCLAVARQWIGKLKGYDIAKEGVQSAINILSATPHSSSLKSLSMLGLGSKSLIKVKTKTNREALDPKSLQEEIDQLNGEPFILISSAGTVNTVDFDDFIFINELKKKYNFWWHIDAAFGAFAACSPRHKDVLNGWEHADSITIDGHKWLNVPYENAFFFVDKKYKLEQIETFQNSNAPYLGDPLEAFNYLNFLPENSRRLKALPVWFTLKAYGKIGYQDIVENSIQLAADFGKFIEKNQNFELLAPVRLNTVCFTLSGEVNQEKVGDFLQKLNATGKVFMTPTVYNNKKGIRAAFVNWLTTENDLVIIQNIMGEVLNKS